MQAGVKRTVLFKGQRPRDTEIREDDTEDRAVPKDGTSL